MSEFEFQAVRSAGFALALCWAVGLQRLSPHSARAGSWRVNVMLWAVNNSEGGGTFHFTLALATADSTGTD